MNRSSSLPSLIGPYISSGRLDGDLAFLLEFEDRDSLNASNIRALRHRVATIRKVHLNPHIVLMGVAPTLMLSALAPGVPSFQILTMLLLVLWLVAYVPPIATYVFARCGLARKHKSSRKRVMRRRAIVSVAPAISNELARSARLRNAPKATSTAASSSSTPAPDARDGASVVQALDTAPALGARDKVSKEHDPPSTVQDLP
jgi:hypothetical protein